MLIAKKLSQKKFFYYLLIMAFTLGTSGFLLFKQFAPRYPSDSDTQFDSGENMSQIPELANISSDISAIEDSLKKNEDPTKIFEEQKFKALKDNMSAGVEVKTENIGKKNPFEPSLKATSTN